MSKGQNSASDSQAVQAAFGEYMQRNLTLRTVPQSGFMYFVVPLQCVRDLAELCLLHNSLHGI